MAVGGRIPFRGSVRSLNPIESKFRVKGSEAGRRPQCFVHRNAPRINEGLGFVLTGHVPAGFKLFSLGRTVVITDNACS